MLHRRADHREGARPRYRNLAPRGSAAPVDAEVSSGVDDLGSCSAAAVRAHPEIVYPLTDEPWGVRRFFAREPDGHVVSVVGHVGPGTD